MQTRCPIKRSIQTIFQKTSFILSLNFNSYTFLSLLKERPAVETG